MQYAIHGAAGAGKRGLARVLLVTAFTVICTSSVLAAADGKDAPRHVKQGTSLDQIIVSGELDSLSGIRKALLDSEQRFNARYNELNKDDDYDVVCRDDIPTDSHIPRWSCQAKIVDKITAQQTDEFFRSLGAGPASQITPPDLVRAQAMLELRERTLALVRSDPELQRNLLERARLEQMYEKLHRKKAKWHLLPRD